MARSVTFEVIHPGALLDRCLSDRPWLRIVIAPVSNVESITLELVDDGVKLNENASKLMWYAQWEP